jgi:hypothetical protein
MKIRLLVTVLALGAFTGLARAQEFPKPGPEHEKFKEMVGDWEATVKFGTMEVKASSTFALDFGGFFLIQTFDGDFGGMKFKGRGQAGYCPIRKKYVSTWIDSMSPTPMTMTGNYDKEGKTFTEEGDGPTEAGKIGKFKSVTKMPDKDTMLFTMYQVEDGKEVEKMSITYKRKK